MPRSSGFTLLEILVALAVIAMAMGALVEASGGYTRNHIYMRDRTYAMWIARNHLVEQQMGNTWPSIGQKKGEKDYAGREWRWVMQVIQTPEEDLRRVDIEVFPLEEFDEEQALARLSGFLEKR